MTLTGEPRQAEERGRKDPVELVARALCVATKPKPGELFEGDAWDLLTAWTLVDLEAMTPEVTQERDLFLAQSAAAIEALGKHGYLSMQYYDWKMEQGK